MSEQICYGLSDAHPARYAGLQASIGGKGFEVRFSQEGRKSKTILLLLYKRPGESKTGAVHKQAIRLPSCHLPALSEQ